MVTGFSELNVTDDVGCHLPNIDLWARAHMCVIKFLPGLRPVVS